MDGKKDISGEKLRKTIKIIVGIFAFFASVCTVLGINAAGVLSSYNGDITPASPIITDHGFSREQELVNHYVLLCKKQVIPPEEWERCTEEELYYIRNGIYAYEGMIFKKDYYKAFFWYNGRIPMKDFKDGLLNYYQNVNISNIRKAEELKKIPSN